MSPRLPRSPQTSPSRAPPRPSPACPTLPGSTAPANLNSRMAARSRPPATSTTPGRSPRGRHAQCHRHLHPGEHWHLRRRHRRHHAWKPVRPAERDQECLAQWRAQRQPDQQLHPAAGRQLPRSSPSPRRPVTSRPSSGSISAAAKGSPPPSAQQIPPPSTSWSSSENAGTQTTVQSSEKDPSNYGDSVTFTATVTPDLSTYLSRPDRSPSTTASTAIDTATLVNGSATLHHVHPRGRVALDHRAVRRRLQLQRQQLDGLTQTVNPSGSQTGLQSSEDPSVFADSVTFTATVSPLSSASGIATPTGQVEFLDGSTLLATETLSGGSASYTTSSLALGANQQIEAKYLGDTNYNPSNLTIQQTVNTPPLTDFWTGASAAKGGNDNWSNPGNWALGHPYRIETAYFTIRNHSIRDRTSTPPSRRQRHHRQHLGGLDSLTDSRPLPGT